MSKCSVLNSFSPIWQILVSMTQRSLLACLIPYLWEMELTKVLVLFVAGCVSSFTLVDALGCVSTLSSAGGSAAIHMVLTGRDGVGTTACIHKVSERWMPHWQRATVGPSPTQKNKTTHQRGSQRGLQRPVLPWSRSPRQLKGSHHYI